MRLVKCSIHRYIYQHHSKELGESIYFVNVRTHNINPTYYILYFILNPLCRSDIFRARYERLDIANIETYSVIRCVKYCW